MEKKIGILTFHRAINYGAVLQAYSLSRYLSQKGCKVDFIDYYPKEDEKDFDVFRSWISPKGLVYNILVLPYALRLKRRKNKFHQFIDKYLNLTEREYTPETLSRYDDQYDTFITGSDQVFNPVSENSIRTYYLTFARKTDKVAYAPSFGLSSFDEILKNKVTNYLSTFKGLSCRESKGALFIKDCTNKECPVVVDPVFLMNKENWENVIADVPANVKGDYIFLYDLNGRESLIQMAHKLKTIHDLPIVCLTTKKYGINYDVDKLLIDVGPLEFVKYIADAKYVLTDSFHGLSFSIILRKKFLSLIAVEKSSERISNLLNVIGEQKRLVVKNNIEFYDYATIDSDWDYDNQLQEMIDKSYEYIKTNIL